VAYNILIVDDSATMRAVIARTIKLAQLPLGEIFQAPGGREALKLLAQQKVDLALVDINMPGMSGVELAEQMRANQNTQSIPVVIVSTEASTARIEELKTKGVKGYVHKPFTPEMIRDVVTEVLGACHAANQ